MRKATYREMVIVKQMFESQYIYQDITTWTCIEYLYIQCLELDVDEQETMIDEWDEGRFGLITQADLEKHKIRYQIPANTTLIVENYFRPNEDCDLPVSKDDYLPIILFSDYEQNHQTTYRYERCIRPLPDEAESDNNDSRNNKHRIYEIGLLDRLETLQKTIKSREQYKHFAAKFKKLQQKFKTIESSLQELQLQVAFVSSEEINILQMLDNEIKNLRDIVGDDLLNEKTEDGEKQSG